MADCNSCAKNKAEIAPVPYIVHESDMARLERTIKRLWILLILLIVLLVGSNIAWTIYEGQFETVETTEITQDVDTGEGDAFVSGTGDVNYGESSTDG
jgi:hypothetical protein